MNRSLWLEDVQIKSFPKLEFDMETDVTVVGGGITGITSALLLSEEGYKVTLVDAGRIMHGTTGHTTGKVTIQHDIIYERLIAKFGLDSAKMYAAANAKGLELIKRNIADLAIDCDFESVPAFVYTEKDCYKNVIEKEYDACQKLGIDAFMTDKPGIPLDVKLAIGFKNQGHFHITKYLDKLIEEFEKGDDAYIYEHSKVVDITEDNNFCHTTLDNGVKIKSRHVIVASHYPNNKLYNWYFTRLKPSITYLLAAPYKVDFENGDYISYEQPIRTFRKQIYHGQSVLIFGGDNHETGHSPIDDHFDNLEHWGTRHFGTGEVLYHWCTQDYKTFDHVPYIGPINRNAKHIFTATGFNKWGITTSHVAGMLLRDYVNNHPSEYENLFTPERFSDRLTCKFFLYNLKGAACFVGNRLKPAPKTVKLANDEGKIVSLDGKKYGAYRDENGELFIVDATCPHLKCILKFNPDQRTYDCPCHGSRFTYKGKYIDGPAQRDLKQIKNIKGIE